MLPCAEEARPSKVLRVADRAYGGDNPRPSLRRVSQLQPLALQPSSTAGKLQAGPPAAIATASYARLPVGPLHSSFHDRKEAQWIPHLLQKKRRSSQSWRRCG